MADNFHTAVENYRVQQVKYLIKNRVPINCHSCKGAFILLPALRIENPRKRKRMFKFLLQHGADVCAVDASTRRGVLAWACALSRDDEVQMLLETAPGSYDFLEHDAQGYTALHHAVESRNTRIVELLCSHMHKYGVAVDSTGGCGLSPYLLAQKLGLTDAVRVLENVGGASPHQRDQQNFHSGDMWYSQGKSERRKHAHHTLTVDMKINGGRNFFKLPVLDARSPGLSSTHIIQPEMLRSDTMLSILSKTIKLPSISSQKQTLSDNHSSSTSQFSTRPPSCRVKSTSGDDTVSLRSKLESGNELSLGSLPNPAFPGSATSPIASQRDEINELMRSSSTQLCPSYRASAISPPRSRKEIQAAANRLSTIVMVVTTMKGKAHESKSKVKKEKRKNDLLKKSNKKMARRGTDSMLIAKKKISKRSVVSVMT